MLCSLPSLILENWGLNTNVYAQNSEYIALFTVVCYSSALTIPCSTGGSQGACVTAYRAYCPDQCNYYRHAYALLLCLLQPLFSGTCAFSLVDNEISGQFLFFSNVDVYFVLLAVISHRGLPLLCYPTQLFRSLLLTSLPLSLQRHEPMLGNRSAFIDL